MAKKNISEIERGAGFFQGFVTLLMEVVRLKEIPFEAIYRLVTPEGRGTLERMLDLAREDFAPKNDAGSSVEYKVTVTYEPFPSQEKLRKRFNWVSALYDGREFEDHPSCKDIDRTPGERTFVLKHFGKAKRSEQVIEVAENEGCRVATKEEAIAFAAAHPDLQRKFWIVALGSSALHGDGDRCVPVLGGDDGERSLCDYWFDSEWYDAGRFLLVRK